MRKKTLQGGGNPHNHIAECESKLYAAADQLSREQRRSVRLFYSALKPHIAQWVSLTGIGACLGVFGGAVTAGAILYNVEMGGFAIIICILITLSLGAGVGVGLCQGLLGNSVRARARQSVARYFRTSAQVAAALKLLKECQSNLGGHAESLLK